MKVSRRFKKLLAAISLEETTNAVVNFARIATFITDEGIAEADERNGQRRTCPLDG